MVLLIPLIGLANLVAAAQQPDYLPLVRGCCDVLIEKGRDRYGPLHSPLFMSILDVETQAAVQDPPMLDGQVRTEGRPHRRNPGGSDLWEDQSLIRVLKMLSQLTGDEAYSRAADDYISWYLLHCWKPTTGLLVWGTHLYWDAFGERPGGDQDGAGPHEILVREPFWEIMAAVSPEGVQREIEGLWDWHVVDKQTGLFNRHDDRAPGCDFAFIGSELVYAFAFLYKQTGDPIWRDRSHLIANWHGNARNKDTGLAPDAPGITDRYDGTHCFTTLSGPYASLLLRAYVLTRDPFYLEAALGHLKAYDRYGWDAEAESYWGMLALDGTPVPEPDSQPPRQIEVYDDFKPTGHVDVWVTTMYSYEFPVLAAQSYAYAAELTGDPEMLRATERWVRVIEKALPPTTGRRWAHLLREALPNLDQAGGTYAENYGRAVDFFLRAAVVLKEPRCAEAAREIAADAIARLHHPNSGLFMGHAAKRTYEATDGVGYLLYALLELDAYPRLLHPNF